jgi:hypothetical protein
MLHILRMECLAKMNIQVIPFDWVVSGKSKGAKKCELSYHLTLGLNFKFEGRSIGQRAKGIRTGVDADQQR